VTASVLPGLALLPATVAVPLIVLSGRRPRIRETWSMLAAVAQTALVAAMIPCALAGTTLTWSPFSLAEGSPFVLRADPLGVFFAVLASSLWVATTVYSIGYTRALAERAQTRYFACFALALFSTVGVALAGTLLTFFAFFELLTVVTYPLVIHKGTPEAAQAGRIYLGYTLTGGAALLGAIAATQVLAGRTDFVPGGLLAGAGASSGKLWALFLLFLIGCGVKAAIVPLHTWLPVAMIAPTPVSALLHAVAVVKAGVFGLARVTGFVFGPGLLHDLGADGFLAAIAGATVLLASLAALFQDNLKRLLAFSTIGQLSYVVLGLAIGRDEAYVGAVLHMASHGLLKISLFFCAGAIYVATYKERISELDGVGRRMPWTMAAFTVAGLLLSGIPPGLAFASKWRLLGGAAAGGAWISVGMLGASGVLNAAYFVPVALRAFLRPDPGGATREVPPTVVVPLLITTGAGTLLGLWPWAAGLLPLAEAAARSVFAR
jgi:multicomponent Na+:H+ antiporter subunit D